MAKINFILQGKGGVGKSFTASLLAQHYRARGDETVCIDTDPVNATFSGYAAYDVQRLELLDGDNINPRAFDELIEVITTVPEKAVVVIDNGAATFIPICSYLIENDIISFLREAGHTVLFHMFRVL